MRPTVLVVEDGDEYTTNLRRFLGHEFEFARAGDGIEALEWLSAHRADALFLDMKFDRSERLVGRTAQLEKRFSGDESGLRRFLEDHQGTFVLASIRGAGHAVAAVFSYDFTAESRRFERLRGQYSPLEYLVDTAGPAAIRAALLQACERTGAY